MVINVEVYNFLKNQGCVLISTLDPEGKIHSSIKGIVGLEKEGHLYVIDLYRGRTYRNLQNNPTVTVSCVNEDKFIGYSFQGKAKIVPRKEIQEHIIEEWEQRIIERISKRMQANIQHGTTSQHPFEAALPQQPKYLIVIELESVVDLVPANLK